MKITMICCISLWILASNSAQIITSRIVDALIVPNNDPNKITGCTRYRMTVSTTNTSFQCVQCSTQHRIDLDQGWELKLVTIVGGQKRCIKKMFFSEGCQFYKEADDYFISTSYVQINIFQADEAKDPMAYRKPFTCVSCYNMKQFFIVRHSISYYYGYGIIVGNFNSGLSPDPSPYTYLFITINQCISIKTATAACSRFQGAQSTYTTFALYYGPWTQPKLYIDDAKSKGLDFQTLYYDFNEQNVFGPSGKVCQECPADIYELSLVEYAQYIQVECSCVAPNTAASLFNADLCHIPIPNCISYKYLNQCQQCTSVYSLYNNQCSICNCANGYFTDSNDPNSCVFNSFVSTISCPRASNIIPYCKTLTLGLSSNLCTQCLDGFLLRENGCYAIIANCIQYRTLFVCRTCEKKYTVVDKRCAKIVYYCAQYSNQTLNCVRCLDNLTLLQNFPQECVQKPHNCQAMSPQTGKCTKCSLGRALIDEKCQILYVCKENQYKNEQGQCKPGNFPFCSLFNKFGVCLTCRQSYRFNPVLTACVPNRNLNSEKCDQTKNTDKIKFHFIESVCVPIDIHCHQTGILKSGCFKCIEKYHLYEKICYPYTNGIILLQSNVTNNGQF